MREREKETETRKGNVSTTGERNVKERKAGKAGSTFFLKRTTGSQAEGSGTGKK